MLDKAEDTPHKYGLSIAYLAVIYFIVGRLSTLLAMPSGYSTALFPASGLALFAILRYGYKVWPGILIGSFLLNGSISIFEQDLTLLNFIPIGLSIGSGACGEALIGAYFLYRFTRSNDPFYQVKSIFVFIVFTSGVSSLISATCGTFTLTLSGLSTWSQFNETFLTWWLGDSIGILIATPILILFSRLSFNRFSLENIVEASILLISLVVVSKMVFAQWIGNNPYPLAFLPFPLLLWAVYRYSGLGTIISILVVSTISIWETIHGKGPFYINDEPNTSLLLVQTYLGVASSMALTFYTSLTEKERVYESLRKSEEQLTRTEEFSLIMVTHVGLDGSWLKVPQTLCDLLGYTREELLDQNFRFVTHPDDFMADWSQCQRLIRGEIKSFDLEKRCIRKDGEITWVYLNYSIVLDAQNNPVHFLNYIRDITERKNLEDALKKYSGELEDRVKERTQALERSNQSLEEFAYLASHDLQEPLRKITTFSDRIIEKQDSLNEETRDYLNRMRKAAKRMSDYIYDLLEYSRATHQPKFYKRISLRKIVVQIMDDLSNQINKSNASIHLEELPSLDLDPVHFPKVIQNLLSNAIKYHREDVAPIINITSSFLESTKQWQIEVSDNGIGIDEKYYSRIFKPFERLHGRSAFEGTGIGLAICEKVMHRHGGEINVRPNQPHGTTFVITLPEHQKKVS